MLCNHQMKHLDFLILLLESKQSQSFGQTYAAHARRRLLDSLRTAAGWDHHGALTELERVRERTAAALLQSTRFARLLSLTRSCMPMHRQARVKRGQAHPEGCGIAGAGDQKKSWERPLCA